MKACWLHISDFHLREGESYDRDVVLRALIASVDRYRKEGRKPDLIFATGDIAQSGKAGEYKLATDFFDALLAAAGLQRRQLFIVPGNHDCDRAAGRWLVRTLESREDSDTYFTPGSEKPHVLQKQAAFIEWYDTYFAGIRRFPRDSSCGPVEAVDAGSMRIGVLPINSALFCQDDSDYARLWIGRRCLDGALQALKGLDVHLKVALLHHPLDWLSDVERANIKSGLDGHVDCVLRGHLHENEIEQVVSVGGSTLRLAAGAAYQTRRWPNRALYVTLDANGATVFPIRYEDNPHEVWVVDPGVFHTDKNYERRFPIARLNTQAQAEDAHAPDTKARVAAVRIRSNIPIRGNRPFIGREGLLEEIAALLPDLMTPGIVVLHGLPGVGKSELAREYARRNVEHYRGGTFFVDASRGAEWIDLARIGADILNLNFDASLPLRDQCERTLAFLANLAEPVLLIYDNVASLDNAHPWLPRIGMRCHILITMIPESRERRWPDLHVTPLTDAGSVQLVETVGGAAIPEPLRSALIEYAQGLPVQLLPAAQTLAYEARRGHLPARLPSLMQSTHDSFRLVYERLSEAERLLLHAAAFLNSQRIPAEELYLHIGAASGWNRDDFYSHVAACQDLHLLEGTSELRMHQLFARFLLDQKHTEPELLQLKAVRETQRKRFLQLARALARAPAQADLASALAVFSLRPEDWERIGAAIDPVEGEICGRALAAIGNFDTARPWHERAIVLKERGNAAGLVDHESLGSSLHCVGFCLSSVGEFAAARTWYERAVLAKERGNLRGQVNHESLGRSVHSVGFCLTGVGEFDAARRWYERAVAAKQSGNLAGRVDSESLGSSIHCVGHCLSSVGELAAALPWYEKAVAAKERGHVFGRGNHESLGRSLHTVGNCLSGVGDHHAARHWYERAVAAKERGDRHGRVNHESVGRSVHAVGFCLSSIGDFVPARGWFERAVAAKERGNVYGRVDHESLSSTLHCLGFCLSSSGEPTAAQHWYERAVAESELGDVYGRVNHGSLGRSLHAVASCVSRLGDFDAARPWYERAVAAKEKGDVHGRVDHESLGRSLHEVGTCLSRGKNFAAALPWYERAVTAKERGDLHGRVDHESLRNELLALAGCLRNSGRNGEASDQQRRADELQAKVIAEPARKTS